MTTASPRALWTTWSRPWAWPASHSHLCGELKERAGSAFLNRPIEGDWPYLWIDATYFKAREAGPIVSVAEILAVAVNTEGQRQVIGMKIGPSEAESFWTEFLRLLMRAGCTVSHWLFRRPSRAGGCGGQGGKGHMPALPGAIHMQFPGSCQRDPASHGQCRRRHRLRTGKCRGRPRAVARGGRSIARQELPKLGALMGSAEDQVPSWKNCPRAHWLQIHSTNPLERFNAEIKWSTNVVGIFPSEVAVSRLVCEVLP